MRHRSAGIKLNRTSSHRKAMFRNMVTSLFKHERIRTTDAKAKEVRRWADKLVTLAKRGDLHARRQALSIIREKDVVHKLFEEAPQRFGQVNGGYTRVVKVGFRPGDAAPVSMVELVTPEVKKKKTRRKKKVKQTASPTATSTPAVSTDVPAEDAATSAETAATEPGGEDMDVNVANATDDASTEAEAIEAADGVPDSEEVSATAENAIEEETPQKGA